MTTISSPEAITLIEPARLHPAPDNVRRSLGKLDERSGFHLMRATASVLILVVSACVSGSRERVGGVVTWRGLICQGPCRIRRCGLLSSDARWGIGCAGGRRTRAGGRGRVTAPR